MTSLSTFVNTFAFNDTAVRVVRIDGQPWFFASDVAEILGYVDGRWAVRTHTDPTQRNTVSISTGNRGNPNRTVISEGGVNALILGSTLPAAQRFKLWVTDVVLPTLRKDGVYALGEEKVAVGEESEEELTLRVMDMLRAKIDRIRKEKELAEARAKELEGPANIGIRIEGHERTVARVVRAFPGVNSQCAKRDLMLAGYLYRSQGDGTYRVYAKYRDVFFSERFTPDRGFVDIIVLLKGYELLERMLREGKLTMKKGW